MNAVWCQRNRVIADRLTSAIPAQATGRRINRASRSRSSSARPHWAIPKLTAARVGGFRFETCAPFKPTMLGDGGLAADRGLAPGYQAGRDTRRAPRSAYLQRMPEVPLSMVIVTVEPGATLVPALGVWPITCPGAMHRAVCWMRVKSPTAVSSRVAWAAVSPSRSGTVTAGPREMVRFTGDPAGSTVPAGEFWSITIPALNGLATRVTVPTTSPDPARWPATSPSSTPITGGTVVVGTTRRTITFALVAERNV